MVLIEQITKRFCYGLFALALALSGFGMETAHAQSSHEAPSILIDHELIDHVNHKAHVGVEHDHHASMDLSEDQEGHAECTTAACCHTGGGDVQIRLTAVDGSTAIFAGIRADQYSDPEKDRADKPPKHI